MPLLPDAAAAAVQDIVGLDDLIDAQPGAIRAPAHRQSGLHLVSPQVQTGGPQPCATATVPSAPGAYTADQVASAYGFSDLYGQGDEGQGQTVAVIEGEPDLASDIAAYQSCYGTSTSVSYVPVDGGPGTGSGSGEAALDIEQIIGLAPRAHVVVYQSQPDLDSLFDDYATAVSDDTAKVISTSWGFCEALATDQPDVTLGLGPIVAAYIQAENTLFEEAATQGQSVVAASGDDGSEECDSFAGIYQPLSSQLAVEDPSAQPFVTGVGGTTLPSSDAPSSETVWNSFHAGGGGISDTWPMPSYQFQAPPAWGSPMPIPPGARAGPRPECAARCPTCPLTRTPTPAM